MFRFTAYRMLAAALLTGAVASGGELGSADRVVTVGGSAGARMAPVQFQNGFFVTFDREAGTISLTNREGRRLPDFVLRDVPGVSRVELRAVAVAPGGEVVAAATCWDAESRAVAALIWADPAGGVRRVVRTTPYAAMALRFAEDGTLWTAGRESGGGKWSAPGHAVVRQFRADGKLMAALLPVETFPVPKLSYHPAELVEMAAPAGGGMDLFVPASAEWIEITGQGQARRTKMPVATDGSEMVTGAAVTGNGDVVLSVQAWGGEAHARLVRYRKADGSTEVLAQCAMAECAWMHVAGWDGNALVLEGQRGQFGWFGVERLVTGVRE